MRRQVVIDAVRPRIHQRLQPLRTLVVLRLHVRRIDEELHPQIAIDLVLSIRLGQPAEGEEVVVLDAVEIVFALRVDHSVDRVGIRFSKDVSDAPVVADDFHVALRRGLR